MTEYVLDRLTAHATLHLAELVRCQTRQCLVALHAQHFYLLTTHLPVFAIAVNVGRSVADLTADSFEMDPDI